MIKCLKLTIALTIGEISFSQYYYKEFPNFYNVQVDFLSANTCKYFHLVIFTGIFF